MSNIALRHCKMNLRAQGKAIQGAYALLPNARFELSCNAFNGRSMTSFEVICPKEDFIKIASRFFVRTDDLFDFGRPRLINKGWHIWDFDFVRINLHHTIPLSFCFGVDYGTKLHTTEISLLLNYRDKIRCGLKDWKKQYPKLRQLLNSNKELKSKYQKQIDAVNENVLHWEKAIKDVANIQI